MRLFNFKRPSEGIGSDKSGNVTVIFALSLLPAVTLIGAGLDYSRATSVKATMQAAVDAAALTTVRAASLGVSSDSSLNKIGTNAFNANMKAGATSKAASCTPSVSASTTDSVSSATVSCSGSLGTSMLGILGINSLPLHVSATAQAYAASIASAGFNGTGYVWGDPHLVMPDGTDVELENCNTGNWYNLLSDSKIEINITCKPWAGNGVPVVTAFTAIVDTHVISLTYPDTAIAYVGSGIWTGYDPVLVIDGVTQPLATSAGASYLSGVVTYQRVNPNDWMQGLYTPVPTLTINNGQYNLSMSFTYGGFITMIANGGSKCGIPGGIFGPQLVGNDSHLDATPYLVASASSTTTQFSLSQCSSATLGPRLLK